MLIEEALIIYCALIPPPDGSYSSREDANCVAKVNVCYIEESTEAKTKMCLDKIFNKDIKIGSGEKQEVETKTAIRKYSEVFKR